MAPTVPIGFSGQKESRKCSFSQSMGKSRKYSKGHASGFIPDYRHVVETIGESEGFGSTGRVETELTVSEGSCAPKRKSLNVNADGYGSFDIPLQVLSLSKMSRSERKELEYRLKMELEQVRNLQTKVSFMSSNTVSLSPSSDIRSTSDRCKLQPVKGYHRSVEVTAPQRKKRAPPGRNGPRTKKITSMHSECAKHVAAVATTNAMVMEKCEDLLDRLMSHSFAWVFNTPVDVVKLNIPDYFTIIKHPMDLGTVKSKLKSGEYSTPLAFASDVRLTFSNAMTYNPPGNDVHIMANTLCKYFEMRWKPIEKKLSLPNDMSSGYKKSNIHKESEKALRVPPQKKKKLAPNVTSVPVPMKRVMIDEEKHKLSNELEALLGELPETIVEFLKEHGSNSGQTADDEIEIDIDALNDDTLFKLRELLDEYLLEKQKKQAKAEPCEIEVHNVSGFSNSSTRPGKGSDPFDEDVDIVGGNDPPYSSYPSIEIEKDAAHRNSKCNSSSCSSSESGSSSSDSDGGSSSESESDIPKVVDPNNAKEDLGSKVNMEKMNSDPRNSESGNLNGGEQLQQNSLSKPSAIEADAHQEGESAPAACQVSPKQYRAALLRSRFADTILKAREKALEKGEKRDPEKLRMEREELERRQKEEKARLQAEAKAAEEARRKVAAEAKRKREREREAARQALLQMEKTVDINENSQFLEDLEMLRAVDDGSLDCFAEETHVDSLQNGLGSFKLQGSINPLEQLGLYMKVDDEDEEDDDQPPFQASKPTTDVGNEAEEGEINFD